MTVRLHEATVDRYGALGGWSPALRDGLTVVSGPNEAGKTLYLEAILRLLDPEVVDVLEPPARFDDAPVGRIDLEYAGDRYTLAGDRRLSEVAGIQPNDLQTVFVVRDNDLALPEGADYYTQLVEHLGEVHSSTVEAVIEELKRLGRLTDARLDVSRQYDDARDTLEGAEALRETIEAYLDEIEAEGMDDLHRKRLALEREVRRRRDELASQRDARAVHEHDRLSAELERYREATARLADLDPFTRDRLDELRGLADEVDRLVDRLDRLSDELGRSRDELAEAEDELEAARDRVARLERRLPAAETARDRLRSYRERSDDAAGLDRRVAVWRRVAAGTGLGGGVAIAAAAIAGSTLATGLAGALLLATALASVAAYRAVRRLEAVDRSRVRALETARDAGFEVSSVEDIAPALESFFGELDAARATVARVEERVDTLRESRDGTRDERDAAERRLAEAREDLEAARTDLGVESIDEVRELVAEREEVASTVELAEQRLVDALGEPTDDAVADWRRRIDDLLEGVDTAAVDPDDYEEARLEDLETRIGAIEAERRELEEALERYDGRLDRIDDRARELATRPFVGEGVALEGRTPAALRALADRLAEVVEVIERDAEVSREAVRIFEAIAAEEERKIADLFDPEGPASRAFRHITDGRYARVDYDPTDDRMVVERADGGRVPVAALSEGTADQLYLASRLSLAGRLLDVEAGFLLLDDPLVGADPDRLRRGFETLVDLADEGWQILYLTAKDEVYGGMVEAFDLPHERFETLA